MKYDTVFPVFLTGVQGTDFSNSRVNDFGFSGTHDLPWHGAFSASYNYTDVKSDFGSTIGQNANDSSYTTNSETAYVSFHPTLKLGLFADESYISNLSGYFYQALINTGSGAPLVDLGTGSHATTFRGGATINSRRTCRAWHRRPITIKRIWETTRRGPMSAVL
jgi:hypothetical protein